MERTIQKWKIPILIKITTFVLKRFYRRIKHKTLESHLRVDAIKI